MKVEYKSVCDNKRNKTKVIKKRKKKEYKYSPRSLSPDWFCRPKEKLE